MHSHKDICLLKSKINFLVKKKQIKSVFWSQILVTDGLEIAFSIPVCCTSAGGLSFFFSPFLPLLWETEKERIEKEVIVWSDSQRVALIRSTVEQTVFTDSDREGVSYRLYSVRPCEFIVRACTHFCFCHFHNYASVCMFACM